MANNDDRWTPGVRGDKPGDLLTSVNEVVKLIYQYLHFLEGRVGEVALRDSLAVDGDVVVADRLILAGLEDEPGVAEADELALYYDLDEGEIMVSVDEGEWEALIPVVPTALPDVVYTKDLVNNVVTGIFEIALPTGTACGGTLRYFIRAIFADALQAEGGLVTFAAINEVSFGYGTSILATGASQVISNSGPNTLSVAFSIVSGAEKITISVNANSSLSPTTLDIRFSLDDFGPQDVTIV